VTRASEWLSLGLRLITYGFVNGAQMFSITAEAGGIPAVYDDAEIARLPQLQNLTTELATMTTKCVCQRCCMANTARFGGVQLRALHITLCAMKSLLNQAACRLATYWNGKQVFTRWQTVFSFGPEHQRKLRRLREVETALRDALQEKELLERKLARLTANRETDVTTLQVSEGSG